MNEYRVFFVLGGPGAGKGTQSDLMINRYPCVHLSAGQLLREEANASPENALMSPSQQVLIRDCLVSGKIVPVEISLGLLQKAMERFTQSRNTMVLIDGFPRNFDNLEGWNRCMKGVASVWGVLFYTCPLEVLEDRILERAETSGRTDDNLKSAQKRFATFERETVPVVEFLRNVQNTLEAQQSAAVASLRVENIKGDQTIEEVWRDTQMIMDRFVSNDVWTANAQLIKAILEKNEALYDSLSMKELQGRMQQNEIVDGNKMEICDAKMEFVTGTKVIVSYDILATGREKVRETRVWSYEGERGWIHVHFTRTPIP